MKILCQKIHEESPQRHYHLWCVSTSGQYEFFILSVIGILVFAWAHSMKERERERRRKYIEIRWHFMLAKGKFNQWLLLRSFSFFIFISSHPHVAKIRGGRKTSKSNIKRKRIIRGSSNGVTRWLERNSIKCEEGKQKFIFLGTFRILTTGHFSIFQKDFSGHSFDSVKARAK